MSWKSYFILIAVVLLSALGIWLGHFLIGTCNIDWELIQIFQTAIICSGTPCEHEYADPVLGCTDCLNTGWLEPPFAEFAQLWDTTIKPADISEHGWNANPWVWVIEFERCKKPKEW